MEWKRTTPWRRRLGKCQTVTSDPTTSCESSHHRERGVWNAFRREDSRRRALRSYLSTDPTGLDCHLFREEWIGSRFLVVWNWLFNGGRKGGIHRRANVGGIVITLFTSIVRESGEDPTAFVEILPIFVFGYPIDKRHEAFCFMTPSLLCIMIRRKGTR